MGEDGLAGVSDREQFLCFSLALWNGRDPILKERLFGLTGNEGNRRRYQGSLFLSRQHAHPQLHEDALQVSAGGLSVRDLVHENRRRGNDDAEYELVDTGAFSEDRYFDLFVEYAKAAPDDLLIAIEIVNRGPGAPGR